MFDYIKWRGDLSFSQDPYNAVDALVFSSLAYVRYTGQTEVPMTVKNAADLLFALPDYETRSRVRTDLDLLHLAAQSQRFGQCVLGMYRDEFIPEQETQFAAMTFFLDSGELVVAFRGTDNSLVGWKEDFNMTFQQTIPAQRRAVQYTRDVALEYTHPMHLAGHSKGGNLAVFAAARSSPMIQSRILSVISNDGPGFTQYLMGDPGYLAMVPKIRTYVPQSSIIGMLLEHEEPYTVIRSKTLGILQHDPYSWEILGREFLPVQEVTETSQFLDATIKTWFADMTNQERNQLVDVMFTLLGTGGVENALDIFQPRNIKTYIKTLSSDSGIRRVLSTEFQGLMEAARKTRDRMEEEKLLEEGNEEGES